MAAASSPTGIAHSIQPIPSNLRSFLPHPDMPWKIGPDVFARLRSQGNMRFRKCEVLSSDPEYYFILKYFFQQKPPGISVRKIECVHNPSQSIAFEASLPRWEEAAQTFLPAWDEEEPKVLRAKVTQRWQEQVAQFSPIVDEERKERYNHIKILPLWHGTRHVDSICSIGFTFFGKHHKQLKAAAAGAQPGAQQSTDIGYFGSGIYFTNSAGYAYKYAKLQKVNTILLSWVAMRRPYPVVSDVPSHQKCADMVKLEGHGAYQNSNAHFIPVVPVHANDPDCLKYHPCSTDVSPTFDELVVFQEDLALPRFCIELGVDFPAAPSPNSKNILHLAVEKRDLEAVVHLSSDRQLQSERDESGCTPLLLAAKLGQREMFEALLKNNRAGVTAVDNLGQTALHIAVRQENANTLQWLIGYRELLDTKDKEGNTPLILAFGLGHSALCEMLLQAGASIQEVNHAAQNAIQAALKEGHVHAARHALFWAASQGKTDLLKMFVAFRELLETQNKNGDTPLLIAVYNGHLGACALLLEAGVNAATTNNLGRNALHVAAAQGKLEIVQMLATPELLATDDNEGNTPLMSAAKIQHYQVYETLLLAGLDPLAVNKAGEKELSFAHAVLDRAISDNNAQIVGMLAFHHELLETRNEKGNTPLMETIACKKREAFQILVRAGADPLPVIQMGKVGIDCGQQALISAALKGDINIVQKLAIFKELIVARARGDGSSPLLQTAYNGHRDACEILLKAGADLMATNCEEENALHVAAWQGHTAVVQMLVVNKQLLEAREETGATPLLRAARAGQREICEILLQAGANPTTTNNAGQNAFHLGTEDVIKLFAAYKEELLDARDKEGNTPLMGAARAGREEYCAALLEFGANPTATNNNGENALHLACERPCGNVMEQLATYRELLDVRDKEGNTPLIWAARSGNSSACAYLIVKAGANPTVTNNDGANALHWAARGERICLYPLIIFENLLEARDKDGNTPLMWAACTGNASNCEFLLQAGANPRITNHYDQNVLHIAATTGNIEITQIFAGYKELLNARDKDGSTPLALAANGGHHEICSMLLKAGAMPLVRNNMGESVLHMAVASGNAKAVQIFVAYKDLFEERDSVGSTPLMWAVSREDRKACELLLEAGANPRTVNYSSQNALHIAAKTGNVPIIQLLFTETMPWAPTWMTTFNAFLNARDSMSHTPLMLAAIFGHDSAVECLLKAGAGVAFIDKDGQNALHLAAERGHLKVAQLLAANKKLLETTDTEGNTPFLLAARGGHLSTCKMLLQVGANLEACNTLGRNAYHEAAVRGKLARILGYPRLGGMIRAKDKNGDTPFILAAAYGDLEACKIMLELFNPFETNNEERNALHVAAAEGKRAVVEALVKHKPLIEAQDKSGNTPLLVAAASGHRDVCEILLKAGAAPTASNRFLRSALYLAVMHGKQDVVQLFIEYKELIATRDVDCDTPLLCAAYKGHREICEMLLKAGADPRTCNGVEQNVLHLAVLAGKKEIVQMFAAPTRLQKDKYGETPLDIAMIRGEQEIYEILKTL